MAAHFVPIGMKTIPGNSLKIAYHWVGKLNSDDKDYLQYSRTDCKFKALLTLMEVKACPGLRTRKEKPLNPIVFMRRIITL